MILEGKTSELRSLGPPTIPSQNLCLVAWVASAPRTLQHTEHGTHGKSMQVGGCRKKTPTNMVWTNRDHLVDLNELYEAAVERMGLDD